MVGVAQLVRAPDCGSGGRGFDSHHSPQKLRPSWLNWIEHWVSAPAVTGSNPVEGTTKYLGEINERFYFQNKYK